MDGFVATAPHLYSTLAGSKETSIKLYGHLSNYAENNNNQEISDNFTITEWNQYNIGPYVKQMETGTMYDFGTAFIENRHATLGELRKYIEEKYQ